MWFSRLSTLKSECERGQTSCLAVIVRLFVAGACSTAAWRQIAVLRAGSGARACRPVTYPHTQPQPAFHRCCPAGKTSHCGEENEYAPSSLERFTPVHLALMHAAWCCSYAFHPAVHVLLSVDWNASAIIPGASSCPRTESIQRAPCVALCGS